MSSGASSGSFESFALELECAPATPRPKCNVNFAREDLRFSIPDVEDMQEDNSRLGSPESLEHPSSLQMESDSTLETLVHRILKQAKDKKSLKIFFAFLC